MQHTKLVFFIQIVLHQLKTVYWTNFFGTVLIESCEFEHAISLSSSLFESSPQSQSTLHCEKHSKGFLQKVIISRSPGSDADHG